MYILCYVVMYSIPCFITFAAVFAFQKKTLDNTVTEQYGIDIESVFCYVNKSESTSDSEKITHL